MNHTPASPDWLGTPYVNDTNEWGDGEDYIYDSHIILSGEDHVYANPTSKATGQTAAVDVAFGMQKQWDMLLNIFGWYGLDGKGAPFIGRVHARKTLNQRYNDAYFDGTYANFGDGKSDDDESRTQLATVAHEFGHGFWKYATNRDCKCWEEPGLGEGNSDIMAAVLKSYLSERSRGIPEVAVRSFFRSRMVNPGGYTSPDGTQGLRYYVPDMGSKEEHAQGTTYGHAFVFLALGSVSDPKDPLYSKFLPNGMIGVGMKKAADIWYLATTAYLTGQPWFQTMRTAYIAAAEDLYGKDSREVKAVKNAFGGIGVGFVSVDTEDPGVDLAKPIANEAEGSLFVWALGTDDMGVSDMEIHIDGKLVRTVEGESFGGVLDISNLAPGTHTLEIRAKDLASRTGKATKQFVVNGANHLLRNGGFEKGGDNWLASGKVEFIGNAAGSAYLGKGYAELSGTGSTLRQNFKVPADATRVTLSYRLRFYNRSRAPLRLLVQVTKPNGDVLETLETHTVTGDSDNPQFGDYDHFSSDLAKYAGQLIGIRYVSVFNQQGRVSVDNVAAVHTSPVTARIEVELDRGEDSLIVRLRDIRNVDPSQIKYVRYWVDDTVIGQFPKGPYLWARRASTYDGKPRNRITAAIYNMNGNKIGEAEPAEFTVQRVLQLFENPGFESAAQHWARSNGTDYGENAPEAGVNRAFLGQRYWVFSGKNDPADKFIYQQIYIPEDTASAKLSFRLRIDGADPDDRIRVIIRNTKGQRMKVMPEIKGTVKTHGDGNWQDYRKFEYDLSEFKGRMIRVEFRSHHDETFNTNFYLDNVSVTRTKVRTQRPSPR